MATKVVYGSARGAAMAGRISRRYALGAGLSLAGGVVVGPSLAGTAFAGDDDDFCGVDLPWREARRIVARTWVPHFPRRVFNVLSYGAVADGTTDNTGPFSMTNSSCTRAPLVFDVNGLPTDHIAGFTVRDCAFDGVTNTVNRISNVDGLAFTNVTINGLPVTGSATGSG
jgi:hypothetical protein